MAWNPNFKVLLILLGLVAILNISQMGLSFNRKHKINHSMPLILELQEARNDADTFLDAKNTISVVDDIGNDTCANSDATTENPELVLCPQIPPGLGPENDNVMMNKEWLAKLQPGGYYKNKECVSQQTVGIIVPYSGLKKYLLHFLYRLHPFLMKQQSDYQVFVIVNGNKSAPLTRGQLFNAGFIEARKHRQWQCLVLHDTQIAPLDTRNLYRCNWYPRQLVAEIESYGTINITLLPLIGGVITLTPEQYLKVNGFSNRVSGRNADYFDFTKRLQWSNYTLERNDRSIGKYISLSVPADLKEYNETSYNATAPPLHLIDGLTTLSTTLDKVEYQELYTLIQIVKSEASENNGNLLDVLLSQVLRTN